MMPQRFQNPEEVEARSGAAFEDSGIPNENKNKI